MMLFAQPSTQPLLHALGWSLLHFCWQGAAVALLLAIALAVLLGRSSTVRYAACCFALGVMAALPVITFARLAAGSRATENATKSSTIQRAAAPNLAIGFSPKTEPWLARISTSVDRSLPLVTGAWLLGVILLLSRLNVGIMVTRRMKSLATEPAPDDLYRALHDLMRRFKMAQTVRLVHSAMVQVPTVIGWLRPVILIPAGCIAGLSTVQVEAVIAHELAHIRRHDYLVNLLQSLLEALLFYHPAVWWVSKQLRNEREHCCDDLAVAVSGDPVSFARALSFLEERRSHLSEVAVGLNGGVLTMRIRRLLGLKEGPAVSRVAALTMLSISLATAGFCIAGAARVQAIPDDKQAIGNGAGPSALSGPYLQWLDEDVRWIIAPEERAAYLQLPDNASRLQFTQQFWDRRNPAPGSAENKFKEEHYRRIAYANVHFAAGKAGWTSDRGRIYIVNGPPDSIDAHPSGNGAEAKPFETWHYRQILEYSPPDHGPAGLKAKGAIKKDVDLKFVDLCDCGNYELQSPQNQ
jgi:GWxTD domain-containing protein